MLSAAAVDSVQELKAKTKQEGEEPGEGRVVGGADSGGHFIDGGRMESISILVAGRSKRCTLFYFIFILILLLSD